MPAITTTLAATRIAAAAAAAQAICHRGSTWSLAVRHGRSHRHRRYHHHRRRRRHRRRRLGHVWVRGFSTEWHIVALREVHPKAPRFA